VRNRTFVLFWLGIFALPLVLQAQDQPAIPLEKFYVDRKKRPIRAILKPIKFSFSTGVGSTYFNHKLDNMGIYQSATQGPYVFAFTSTPPPDPTAGHSEWIDTNTPITPITVNPGDFLVTSDTARIGFRSKSFTIPVKLSIHYEFKQFRIGIGHAKDFIFIKPFEPIAYGNKIRNVEIATGSISTNKWFLLAGYSFYRIDKFVFTGDLQGGLNKFGKKFDRNFVKASPFLNMGVTVEREMSEYLRFFVRPSYEFKSYTLSLPESNTTIKHHANALNWAVGVTYSIPDLPKCRIKKCNIQINHAHGDREYRSRMHPLWKKQNPGYGENDPKLIKYKWRNRKKINPY
jgi:hypothetical protein